MKDEQEKIHKELEARTSAKGLLIYAKEYYSAYELIQKQHPELAKYFNVKFYLLCHALELVMKAMLRYYGASYAELKRYGHNLTKIQSALYHMHQITTDYISVNEVRLVNELYNNKEFEYHLSGSKHVPEISNLASTVHLLISKAHFDILLEGSPHKLKAQGKS